MHFAYIKLNSKKHLIKNQTKCFFAAILPYVIIIAFSVLNYFLYVYLKQVNFDKYLSVSFYSNEIKGVILTISICLSFLFYEYLKFLTEKYLFIKSRCANATLKQALKKSKFSQFRAFAMTNLLKLYLFVAWTTLYMLPSAIMGIVLYFSSDNLNHKAQLTLVLSTIVLFLMGCCFLYLTMKRYSFTSPIIFTSKEKDALKILADSTVLADGRMMNTAMFSASFFGWNLSCLLLIPMFYVLPYRKLSLYNYYNFLTGFKITEITIQKPIILHSLKA